MKEKGRERREWMYIYLYADVRQTCGSKWQCGYWKCANVNLIFATILCWVILSLVFIIQQQFKEGGDQKFEDFLIFFVT